MMKSYVLNKMFVVGVIYFMTLNLTIAQSAHKHLRNGDDAYKKGAFDIAESEYRRANEKDNSSQASYNLGNSLYEQDRFEEAINQYKSAVGNLPDEYAADAYFNLGNAHFRNQAFKESLDAYKNALIRKPDDQDIKENYNKARMMLRQQQQQQQQQQNQQQDQKQEEQEQDQQQQQQDQNQQNQDQQDQQQQQNQQEQEGQEKNQAQESEKKDLDKDDARKLLEIADNEEQKVQEKLRKSRGNSPKPKKDW